MQVIDSSFGERPELVNMNKMTNSKTGGFRGILAQSEARAREINDLLLSSEFLLLRRERDRRAA